MSFLSLLGKIGKTALGIGAAPVTGGMSLIPGLIDAGGSVLGALGSASSHNRGEQEQAQLNRDAISERAMSDHENALLNRADLEMKQRQMDAQTREQAYRQAMRSQYLKSYHPAERPDGVPMIHGSFNTVSPDMINTAQEMEKQAMLRMLNGEKFDSLPTLEKFTPTPFQGPSTFEKIANIAGPSLQTLSVLHKLQGQNQQSQSLLPSRNLNLARLFPNDEQDVS